ncbi:MAG: MEDS domain-containing protein [Streptosporangiaceae bacterium]
MPPGTEVRTIEPGDHAVLFYRDDAELAGQVSAYLLEAIRDGGAAVVIATPDHRRAFEEQLVQAGADIAAAWASGRYLALDAAETMRRCVVADWPDAASFWLAISPLIRQAARDGRPVRVFGEMVWLLWEDGLISAAIELEAMWNELGGQYPFSLLCAYRAESVSGSGHADELTQVCRAHAVTAGVPPESLPAHPQGQ